MPNCRRWASAAAATISTDRTASAAPPACRRASLPISSYPIASSDASLKRNADIQVRAVRPAYNEEYYALYVRYIEQRHADGDMYPPSRDQFSTFLVRDLPFARFYEFRLAGTLVAVAVTDLLPNGISAVYTFYDPALERRSLGRFAILWQIGETARLGLQAVVSRLLDQELPEDELQDAVPPHRAVRQPALGRSDLSTTPATTA